MRTRHLSAAAVVTLTAAFVVVGGSPVPSSAQVEVPTSTSSPGEPSATTTSTTAPPGFGSTPTTIPDSAGGNGGGPSGPMVGGGDGSVAPGTIPPGFQELIAGVRRSGSRSTERLVHLLEPLRAAGFPEAEILRVGFGRFPVGGLAKWSHDWWYPRFVPRFHLHEGTDIFAVSGTPVRAPWDGVVRLSNGAIGGLAVYVTQPDGTYAYMAHLESFAEGLEDGAQVRAGDVVGSVGDSGNARGGAPHVHLQIHPRGGGPVDPKPIVDRWIDEAETKVSEFLAEHEAALRRHGNSGLRVLRSGSNIVSAPPVVTTSDLTIAGATISSGGGLSVALAVAERSAATIDWDLESRRARVIATRLSAEADQAARLLVPTTPPALALALWPEQ